MRALRLHAARDLRLHDEPNPVPGPGEELVRVTAVGLCGSDLHWYEDGAIGDARLVRPVIPGHEAGGIIAAGPRAGTRVAIDPADPCQRCGLCVAGHGNLCETVRFLGHGRVDGALTTLMAWPARLLVPVPDAIPDPIVPLLEPIGIALHAIELGHVRAGMSACVAGAGPIGLLLVATLRAFGVERIVVTDRLEHRVSAARAMGADTAHLTGADGRPPGLIEWEPVDVAFEASGDDAALATTLAAVKPGGRVVVVGIPAPDRTSFEASLARRKGLSLVLARRMKAQHMVRAIELVATGLVDPGSLVTSRFALSQGPEAFETLVSRAGLKLIVEPGS